MTHRLHIRLLTVSVGLGLATGAPAAPITGAQDGWAAITACAQVRDDDARRDCIDGVLRRAGLLTGPSRSDAIIRLPAQPSPPAPAPEARRSFLGLSISAPETEDQPQIATTIAKAFVDGDGRLVMITSDGKHWRSVDGGLQPPKPGDAITIGKDSMGAYECDLGRWKDYLCKAER